MARDLHGSRCGRGSPRSRRHRARDRRQSRVESRSCEAWCSPGLANMTAVLILYRRRRFFTPPHLEQAVGRLCRPSQAQDEAVGGRCQRRLPLVSQEQWPAIAIGSDDADRRFHRTVRIAKSTRLCVWRATECRAPAPHRASPETCGWRNASCPASTGCTSCAPGRRRTSTSTAPRSWARIRARPACSTPWRRTATRSPPRRPHHRRPRRPGRARPRRPRLLGGAFLGRIDPEPVRLSSKRSFQLSL